MNSVNYYNENSEAFIDRTFQLDVSSLTKGFLELIPKGGTILDLGCGSGRDARAFMEMGYEVYAVDASEKMVAHTAKFLGERVTLATFQEYESGITFDGIWASASLLHVAEDEIIEVIRKYRDMLKSGGIFHMSFKSYETNFTLGERSFTCYDEAGLRKMVRDVGEMDEISVHITDSVKEASTGERWVNGLFRRKPIEYWDILDCNRKMTGRTAIRGNYLKAGDFHLVVFGIIRNSHGEFIISKRAPEKTWPGTWEITAGSAVKGDSSYDAVLREIHEEIGIQMKSQGRLLMSTTVECECSFFTDVWYFEEDVAIEAIVCQPGEVSGVKVVTVEELIEINGKGEFMPGHQHVMACILGLEAI